MIWRLLATVLGGFGAHRLYSPTARFGPRWGQLLRYALGCLLIIPFRLMVIGKLRDVNAGKRIEDDILMGDLLTLGGFGTGVFLGYLTDSD